MVRKQRRKTHRQQKYKAAEIFEFSTGGFSFVLPDGMILCFGETEAEARREFAELCERE